MDDNEKTVKDLIKESMDFAAEYLKELNLYGTVVVRHDKNGKQEIVTNWRDDKAFADAIYNAPIEPQEKTDD